MPEEQIKFDNQEFLSSYIDEIIESLYNNKEDPFLYKNIYRLDTSNDPLPVSLAKFTGKTESVSFNKLKSYQYASLVPKVRLFRVQGIGKNQKEYEYKFNKGTKYLASSDDSNILGTPKGQNCGIVSVEYKLAGTNPVTAERAIEVVLELYFDSINAFSGGNYDKMFEFWKTKGSFDGPNDFDFEQDLSTINYWSLIMHPAYKKDKNDRYDPHNFRIKAVVGWEDIGTFLQQELFSDLPNIKQDIKDTNLNMILQLTSHNFTFNEDGSVGLRAEYIATLENIFTTQKFNIFKGLKEEIEQIKNSVGGASSGQANTLSQQQNRIKLLNYIKENKGDISKLKEQYDKCGKSVGALNIDLSSFADKPISEQALNSIIEKEQQVLTGIEKQIERSILSLKQKYYKMLSDKIIESNNLKSLSIPEDKANEWLKYRKEKASKPTLTLNIAEANSSNNAEITKAKQTLEESRNKAEKDLSVKDEGFFSGLWKSIKGSISSSDSSDGNQSENITEPLNINFTTIGSIIDAAYDVLIERSTEEEKEEINRNKVILSSFSNEIVTIGPIGSTNKNIADIPISITKIAEFLLKNIEEPKKDSYTIKEFLRDIMGQLVETSLNSRTFGEIQDNKYANTSLAFNTFTLKGKEDPINDFLIADTKNNSITTFNKTKKDIRQYYPNDKLSEGESYYNYYLMYDKYLKDFYGTGNKLKDEQLGIYHFSIGQDRGLLKQVTFKRVDQPGLREAKSLGKETLFLGQFRDRYNADLTLFGNNIFTPGMLVFIVPSVEIGNPADPDSFSEITGIGGYYTVISVNTRITQGEYTTTLDCIFHSARNVRTDKAGAKGGCEISELEKAGLIDADGAPTLKSSSIKELTNAYEAEQQKQKENEIKNNSDGYTAVSGGVRKER